MPRLMGNKENGTQSVIGRPSLENLSMDRLESAILYQLFLQQQL